VRLPLDLTGFEEGSVIGEASRLYRRVKDGMEIVVKMCAVLQFEAGEVEMEIETLLNLRHPLITAPIVFGLSERVLKIGRLDAAAGFLPDGVSAAAAWWTPTAKAEAVVRIALALPFAHGLGRLRGGLKVGNILVDGRGRIQIADFRPMRRDGGLSGEGEGEGDSARGPQSDAAGRKFFRRGMLATGGYFSV
jgi:hypothetical protein